MEVWLARHAEHRAGAAGRYGDDGLTERGRDQARRLASALAAIPFARCLVSPLRRARETAELLVAGRNEAFGTWALFDEQPRVATATAVVDSKLLRIRREDFVELLADDVQVTQGVLKTLATRLRKLADQVGVRSLGTRTPD